MHVISRPAKLDAQRRHSSSRTWLDNWWSVATKARWENLHQVQVDYAGTDQVGSCLVFIACGNHFRLICCVTYANEWTRGLLYVKHFLTHAEYDKGKWKADCGR
jgi:mRNA interferase HigB